MIIYNYLLAKSLLIGTRPSVPCRSHQGCHRNHTGSQYTGQLCIAISRGILIYLLGLKMSQENPQPRMRFYVSSWSTKKVPKAMCIYVAYSVFNHPGAAMQVVCPALTTVTWETGTWATESSPCLMGYSWVGHTVMGFNMAFYTL